MPPPQDNVRFIFIIILILWLNAGNDTGPTLLSTPSLIAGRLVRQRAAFHEMSASQWGDFVPRREHISDDNTVEETHPSTGRYLNLTGFREDDFLAWNDLESFRRRCLEWSRNAYPTIQDQNLWDIGKTVPTWQNVTGSVHGTWVRQPASVHRDATDYNLTDLYSSVVWTAMGGSGTGADDENGGNANSGTYIGGYGSRLHTIRHGGSSSMSGSGTLAGLPSNMSDPSQTGNGDDDGGGLWGHKSNPHVHEWGRNITGQSGNMIVRLSDQVDEEEYDRLVGENGEPTSGGLVRTVSATVNLEDVEGTGSSYDMRLHGVHWPRQGALLLTTTSEKFAGIFGLPHLSPGADFFQSSQKLLNRTIDEALRKRENARGFSAVDASAATPLWTSSVDGAPEGINPAPRCEYIMYMQVHPVEPTRFLTNQQRNEMESMRGSAGHAKRSDHPPADSSEEGLGQKNNGDEHSGDAEDDGGLTVEEKRERQQEEERRRRFEDRHWPYDEGDEVQAQLADTMFGIEDELRFPTGAPIPGGQGVPALQMSAVLYSPDCAYFIETKGPPHFAPVDGQHLVGMKSEVFLYHARLWLLAFAAVVGAQVQLLISQVRETYTPSTLGRISFYTAAIMLLADGLVFASASAWTLTAATSFLPSLLVTFVGFVSVTIGGSFLSEIYAAQAPERRRRERQQQQLQQQRHEQLQQQLIQLQQRQQEQQRQLRADAAAARAGTPPIIIPSDQDIDAEIAENVRANAAVPLLPLPVTAPTGDGDNGANNNATNTGGGDSATASGGLAFPSIAGRMVMMGVVLLFLSLAASTWWAGLRAAYTNLVIFLYLSLWVPQIVRNIERNSRRAFAWRFMIGQSVLRLMPVAYFYLREDNIVFSPPDRTAFAVLAGWVWIQLWVLAFQDVLGPRFGIPKGWAPEAWEYHPVLREDDVESAGLPIGLVSTVAEDYPASYHTPTTPKRRYSGSGRAGPGADVGGTAPGSGGGAGTSSSARHSHTNSGSGLGSITNASGVPNSNIWTMDCSICCETLDVPVIRPGVDDPTGGGMAGVLARRQYMVTPCRHIFHTACLEGWLRFRLQCPICREELPPL